LDVQIAHSPAGDLSAVSDTRFLHKLQVHQIELEDSRDRFVEFYEHAPVGYLTLTARGLITEINLTGAALLGAARNTLLQLPFSRFLSHDEADHWQLHLAGVLRENRKLDCELALEMANGSCTHVRLDSLRLDKDGLPPTVRVVLTDITERKLAEDALKESEERWKFALEGAGDGVWDWNVQTGEALYSRRWKEMLGFAESEIEDKAAEWTDRLHPEDLPGVMTAIQAHIDGKTDSATVEYRMLCKDGCWRWILGRGMVVGRDASGKPLRLIGTNSDITERKLAEAALIAAKTAAETANLTKSRFLAAASHDLRQPMQAISLFSDALARTVLSAEQNHISNCLSQSVNSLGDLLNVLLDISKLDAGAVKPCLQTIPVEALIQMIDSTFSSLAADKSLRFKLSFPFREMAVIADGKLLMSLVGNIIGNAIKYTPHGGFLVAVRRRGNAALIQVWDTGIGIAPEYLNTIFEEYFQIGNSERDRAKGLGLGLAIARRVARLLGTDVVCRSRPGKGSVFEFRLPLAELAVQQKPERPEAPMIYAATASHLAGRRIVVIEDDMMVAMAIQLSLESLGARITRHCNAAEALADAAIADADFYISDFQLPGLNGVELLDAIQQRSTKSIRAVLLTGDTSADRIELTQHSGWQVLFKPVDLAKLISTIDAQDL
jgi:PAS domain S-box-containing protein